MTWAQTGDEQDNLAHVLRSHSANKPVLRAHLGLYRAIMFGESPLSRAEREAVAVAVSATNNCHYCTVHHSDGLTEATGDRSIAELVVQGRLSELGERLDTMCRYAIALTRNPRETDASMLTPMRDAGLTDREIIDVNQVVAYFNYVNRVVQGLGVTLEPSWPDGLQVPRDYELGQH